MNLKYGLYCCLLSILSLCFACRPYALVQSNPTYYQVDTLAKSDSSILQLIAPYKEQISAEMDMVIGELTLDIDKTQPESLLGNFTTDAILNIARQQYSDTIHFAVSNYGGLRVPNWSAGDITRGDVFELMPFDNMLVVMLLDGETTLALLNHVAAAGGWPVSGELKMNINSENNTAEQIMISSKAFDKSKKYHVLVSDYMANGGDKCSFLVNQKRADLGLLFRDGIMQFVEQETAAGRKLGAKIEGRITK